MNRNLVNEIEAGLVSALVSRPSRVGMRLRSEPILALQLGVSRKSIRCALDRLAARGILVRRHGSGTYVRKVPSAVPRGAVSAVRPIPPSELFGDLSRAPQRRHLGQRHQSLTIGLLTDLKAPSPSGAYRLIFQGIKERLKENGHSLRLHPVAATVSQEGASPAEVAALLRHRSGYDGFIVHGEHSVLMDALDGAPHPPVAYIGAGLGGGEATPLVSIDADDAMRRALGLLVRAGHRRIGFIGYGGGDRTEYERVLYSRIMTELGLHYRAATFCPPDDAATLAEMRRLFRRADAPQAVYVGDDVVFAHVASAWRKMGIVPGERVGVITWANRRVPLPAGYDWSRMEFDPVTVGRLAADRLVDEIQTAGEHTISIAHRARWRPGLTHGKHAAATGA